MKIAREKGFEIIGGADGDGRAGPPTAREALGWTSVQLCDMGDTVREGESSSAIFPRSDGSCKNELAPPAGGKT